MRAAIDADLQRVVEIYNATVASRMATADTSPVSVASRRQWFQHHHGKRPLRVHERSGDIAGWYSLEDFYGRPAFHATAELSIYVDARYRGSGIGSLLLRDCIALCPSIGVTNLLAYVFSHNAPSIRLLSKFQFKQWGELPGIAEMDDDLYSVCIMGLTIRPDI